MMSEVKDGQVSGRCRPILVIEDDQVLRDALEELFSVEGYEVLTAAEGGDALRKLEQGARPGLILLDLVMPGINGWQFRALQGRYPELAEIPVVVISGLLDLEALGARIGCQEVIKKPFDLEALLAVARRYCGGKQPGEP